MLLGLGCVCGSSLVTHLWEQQPHAGSPCALACSLGFLVPDSIDFDHVVQAMSARFLHGQVALSPFVVSKIFWDRYFETM